MALSKRGAAKRQTKFKQSQSPKGENRRKKLRLKGNKTPKATSIRSILNGQLPKGVSVVRLAEDLFRSINSPTSLGLYLCLQSKDYKELLTHSVNPADYLSWTEYHDDNQCCKLLSKYPGFDIGEDIKVKTKNIFEDAERECEITNQFFTSFENGTASVPYELEHILYDARDMISGILGKLDIEEWLDACRFGPGVSSKYPHGKSDYVKLSHIPSVTKIFAPYAEKFISEFPGWQRSLTYGSNQPISFEPVAGGTYCQVPKSALINRNIETQPLVNGFAQLGLGQVVRRRLKAVGVDLSDQTRNQYYAMVGSITGGFATIDLSNASDTISRELVRWILPVDWFKAMDLVRTHFIEIDGETRHLHRFSSMGNGFTFELETLIFYTLAKSAANKRVKCPTICTYGDDIIVPAKAYSLLVQVLTVCGFKTNPRKSFYKGPFRESCGADWFLGHQVRPTYIKEVPHNVASLISMANGLRRSATRRNNNFGYCRRYLSAWARCYRWIPGRIRFRLAHGSAQDDTYILSGKIRDGFKLSTLTKYLTTDNWYPSVGAALYRAFRRSQVMDDSDLARWSQNRSFTLIRGKAQVLRHIPNKADFRYELVRYRTDSFVRYEVDSWY